ncbi:GGDEF domain-containing protein [Sedimenticola thiotaurini]|uniref:GGDEF domain-containing protein n=1 Tax=Sedimenticola thiotaurini TaxID=1543721 RepID=UPI00069C78D0|nr:GGDEF domain-containing protein [Sedimenticola thiotaurini]
MFIRKIDQERNFQTINMIGLAGVIFLMFFGGNAIFRDNYFIAGVLFGSAFMGSLSILVMRRTQNFSYGSYGISITVALVFCYLIASGGVQNSGPLWCHSLFLVIMLLQGFKKGLIAFFILLVISTVLLFYPDLPFVTAEYSYSFKVRFIASFLSLGVMASIYEYLRSKSQSDYETISRELDQASRTDALTGLANRRAMQQCLEVEQSLYLRHGHPYSLIMMDLDYFKRINDKYGHGKGDEVLITVSRLLLKEVRQQDVVCRWGGEEFMILLPQTDQAQSLLVAEKLRQVIDQLALDALGIVDPVTASFGTECILNVRNTAELIAEADRKLYEAKRHGRNQVFDPTGRILSMETAG